MHYNGQSGGDGVSTHFASAERACSLLVRQQVKLLAESALLKEFSNAVMDIVVVLNEHRQIVFFNDNLVDLLGTSDPDSIYGLRPGEAVGCIRVEESPSGCGTTEFCSACGAVNAILTGQKGKTDIRECEISRNGGGEALNLLVKATPLKVADEQFTLFAMKDISHLNRRRSLERIFFHDIMNTAVSLKFASELLKNIGEDQMEKVMGLIYGAVDRLFEEIGSQRDITAAENNELIVHPDTISSIELLQDLICSFEESAMECTIRLHPEAEDVRFRSDRVVLRRVLGNMIKNAVEASARGETVTAGCKRDHGGVEFRVWNRASMPREVQLQLFQRSFSTKEASRGLGTYSMKLLTERYLCGRISFTTSETEGTVFSVWYPLEIRGAVKKPSHEPPAFPPGRLC